MLRALVLLVDEVVVFYGFSKLLIDLLVESRYLSLFWFAKHFPLFLSLHHRLTHVKRLPKIPHAQSAVPAEGLLLDLEQMVLGHFALGRGVVEQCLVAECVQEVVMKLIDN